MKSTIPLMFPCLVRQMPTGSNSEHIRREVSAFLTARPHPPPPSSPPLSMYRCVAVLSVSPNCRPSCVRYATMPTSTDHSDTIDACDFELLEICDFDVNCQILFDPVGKVSGGGQINPNWFIFSPPWLVSFSRSIK